MIIYICTRLLLRTGSENENPTQPAFWRGLPDSVVQVLHHVIRVSEFTVEKMVNADMASRIPMPTGNLDGSVFSRKAV